MDFVSDQLFDGRKFRALTVIDNYSRKCVGILVGQSIKGEQVVEFMSKIHLVEGGSTEGAIPAGIQVDDGRSVYAPLNLIQSHGQMGV